LNLKPIRLKKDKRLFHQPAVFLNPASKLDGWILREANERFPETPAGTGLEQIEGLLIYAKDYEAVSSGMNLQQPPLNGRTLDGKVFIIHPDLEFALRSDEDDKEKMFRTGILDSKVMKAIETASAADTTIKRLDRIVKDVYPFIDSKVSANSIRYQLDHNGDILTFSGVPITSMRHLDEHLEKCRESIRDSNTILRNVFTGVYGKIDTMNSLTISASIIKPENYNKLIATAVTLTPDQIGIRIINMDDSNESQVSNVLTFFAELFEAMKAAEAQVPVHIFNMNHLSYLAWCYGVSAVSLPISTNPYYKGRRSSDLPPQKGVYYNTEDMTYDAYDVLHRKTRPSYHLPCYCPICKLYITIPKAESQMRWAEFKRLHEVLVRNIECKIFREAPVRIDVALKEKLLRSKKMGWAQFIPDKPTITF
jgi:hypothetical protein